MIGKIFSKKESALIILTVGLLASAFFWYELRPYMAKRECLEESERMVMGGANQPFKEIYGVCLLKKGF